ncbi:MAG: DUF2313 domain-containing protein [Oscillospiraceae bacterium]|nr:DUF2313 domain-containing protein [Oscillospiraceae bacterium]
MSHAQNMKMLLRPMGVYKLDHSYLAAELECVGAAMDRLETELERVQREMCLTTARREGLEQLARLFPGKVTTEPPEQAAQTLMALFRISGDSFTCQALNRTLLGCGLNARVRETGKVNTVEVSFPDVPGIPAEFERVRAALEEILPAQLLIQYVFWYQTWTQMEDRMLTWGGAQEQDLRWDDLEKMVE